MKGKRGRAQVGAREMAGRDAKARGKRGGEVVRVKSAEAKPGGRGGKSSAGRMASAEQKGQGRQAGDGGDSESRRAE